MGIYRPRIAIDDYVGSGRVQSRKSGRSAFSPRQSLACCEMLRIAVQVLETGYWLSIRGILLMSTNAVNFMGVISDRDDSQLPKNWRFYLTAIMGPHSSTFSLIKTYCSLCKFQFPPSLNST